EFRRVLFRSIGPDACAAVPKLTAILKFSSGDLSWDCFRKSAPHHETEVMFLHPGPDSTLRAYAARALGKIGVAARSAIPALQTALADPDDHMAQAAAAALDQLLDQTAIGWYLKAAG